MHLETTDGSRAGKKEIRGSEQKHFPVLRQLWQNNGESRKKEREESGMERCRNYVGVACVDGSCAAANAGEYEERCMEVINCEDCFYYKGCEDCALAGTEYCVSFAPDPVNAEMSGGRGNESETDWRRQLMARFERVR